MSGNAESRTEGSDGRSPSSLFTFLIADVRGYTRFTVEHGDEAAASLADRFAGLCEEVVGAHDGRVVELRGDEVLAIFPSAREALRAAVALQRSCDAATAADPSLPLTLGIGLDAGEAVAVRGGYRGGALNLAARLCSLAGAGEVFASEAVAHLARRVEDFQYIDRGEAMLKGWEHPVRIIQIVSRNAFRGSVPKFSVHASPASHFPTETTSFVGRERELRDVIGILLRHDARLLTLTGPGGTGKTRLALRAASEIMPHFPAGVVYVPLAPIADPDFVLPAIAAALEVQEAIAQPLLDTVIARLRDTHLLLLLDNFEHVLAAAGFIPRLLEACPSVKIMVTSRAVLHIYGENDYAVPPLGLPASGGLGKPDVHDAASLSRCDAIALFVQRAQAMKAGFDLNAENAEAVIQICTRLDGLPLAIELAAARIRILSPKALAARLAGDLKLLTGDLHGLPSRQQTLWSTIEWSYALLLESERNLFARLSLFAGGCTFEAAEAVTQCIPDATDGEAIDTLDGLTSLVEKSLLQQEGEDEPRFFLLETIREFALEKLRERGELEDVSRHHADYYAAMVISAETDLKGEREATWFERFDGDRENIRAAIDWHRHHRPDTALLVGYVLHQYWIMRAEQRERLRWIEDMHTHNARLPAAQRVKLLDLAVHLAHGLGHALEEQLFEQSFALREELGDITGKRDALERRAQQLLQQAQPDEALRLFAASVRLQRAAGQTGALHYMEDSLPGAMNAAQALGDYDQANAYAGEALALATDRKNAHDIARWQTFLGWLARLQGDFSRAEELLKQSLTVQRELADKNCMPNTLVNLAMLALERGANQEAEELVQEGLIYVRELQQTARQAEHLVVLGRTALSAAELGKASGYFEEALALATQVDDKREQAEAVWGLAALAGEARDWKRVVHLASTASALQGTAGQRPAPIEQRRHEQILAAARPYLDEDVWASCWEQGQALHVRYAVTDPSF